MLFAVLLIILIILLTTFICFFVWLRRMNAETFESLCEKKVKRIADRNAYQAITNLNISNYDREKLIVNHAIFGKKYIYLISDFFLRGFVSGDNKDNSWIYYDNLKKKHNYLSNLFSLSSKNMRDFAGILQISNDPIIAICLVPNEVDFKIGNAKDEKKFIVHYSSLGRLIRKLERRNIGELDQEQIDYRVKLLNSKNGEGN